MRKVLEVLQSSTGEITFDTDIDVEKDPSALLDIMSSAIFCMATKLWGGNEHSVVAVIRALFVSDMAISTDRETIMNGLAQEAVHMGKLFNDMMEVFEAKGKVQSFGPGIPRPGSASKRKNRMN
jgi:prophage DNA circulation protein